MSTRVVDVRLDDYDVYIGRGGPFLGRQWPHSRWANPFVVGRDGSREEVVARYERYVRETPELLAALPELDGKVLGCWCKKSGPETPCHGDALVRLVDEVCHPRMPLAEAQLVACQLLDRISPLCERVVVAGSIRRRKPLVKDIELVVVPRRETLARDLFGAARETHDLLHAELTALLERGEIEHRRDRNGRPAFGPSTKRIRWRGRPVDIFGVLPPAQFGVILAIRTGSAEFATRFMTAQRIGGVLPDNMLVRQGQLFRTRSGGWVPVEREARAAFPQSELELIPTPEEEDFFAAIGLSWVAPEERS